METIIGLNVDHHETCLFTKSLGGEELLDLNKNTGDILQDIVCNKGLGSWAWN